MRGWVGVGGDCVYYWRIFWGNLEGQEEYWGFLMKGGIVEEIVNCIYTIRKGKLIEFLV